MPGFTIHSLGIDFMHCDHQGVALLLGANALIAYAEAGIFGDPPGRWEVRTNVRLQTAYRRFKAWCTARSIQHSQRKFNLTRCGMSSKSSWPELRVKSHNCDVICRWLASVAEGLAPDTWDMQLLNTALCAHKDVQLIMERNGKHLGAADARQLLHAGLAFLRAWSLLAKIAEDGSVARFSIRPKHHLFEEGVRRAFKTRRNPREEWVYKHESFVGQIAKVCGRSHVSTLSVRVLQRWLLKFDVP